MATRVKEGLFVVVSKMALPVEFWIAPPVQVAVLVHEPALPVITNLPVAPVLLRTMPLVPPVALTFWKVTLDAPIVALVMFTAGPVGGVVAPMVFVPVTLMVRPAVVEEKVSLAPSRVMPPLIVTVPLVPPRVMPVQVPLPVMAPENVSVPP